MKKIERISPEPLKVEGKVQWAMKLFSDVTGMHLSNKHPVMSENQFHCTRLYSVGRKATRVKMTHRLRSCRRGAKHPGARWVRAFSDRSLRKRRENLHQYKEK